MNQPGGKGDQRRPGDGYADNYLRAMGWVPVEDYLPTEVKYEFKTIEGKVYWRLIRVRE